MLYIDNSAYAKNNINKLNKMVLDQNHKCGRIGLASNVLLYMAMILSLFTIFYAVRIHKLYKS